MKTITAHIEQTRQFQTTAVQDRLLEMTISVREILALLSAVTVATATIIFSIWLSGMNISPAVGAGTWGVAFIFLARAVDSGKAAAILQLSTGVALVTLAWLQYAVSPDYTVVAGGLLAGWVAVALFKWLK